MISVISCQPTHADQLTINPYLSGLFNFDWRGTKVYASSAAVNNVRDFYVYGDLLVKNDSEALQISINDTSVLNQYFALNLTIESDYLAAGGRKTPGKPIEIRIVNQPDGLWTLTTAQIR